MTIRKINLSKPTSKIYSPQLPVETVLTSSSSTFSMHVKSAVGKGCDIANSYKLFEDKYTRLSLGLLSVTYSGHLGDWCTGLGAQTLAYKKHISSFIFSAVFQWKNVEAAIDDFTMHLIISNWLEGKIGGRREERTVK